MATETTPEAGPVADAAPRPTRTDDGPLLSADSDLTPAVSVVMPTMNEEAGIAECIEAARRALSELGLTGEVLVSDSSSDRTPEIAREHGAIVLSPDRRGYGRAYQYAFERARGEYVVMGDADTTYDFRELVDLFETMWRTDADVVLGSRLDGEIRPGAMPSLHRYVGNPLLTAFLNLFYDAGVSDAHSGFRLFRRDLLDDLEFRADGMEFASEMLMRASAAGVDIAEVPITYHERVGEATLESFRDGWRHLKFMLVNAPDYLFVVPGLLLTLLGVGLTAAAASHLRPVGVDLRVNSVTAGALLSLVGVQVLALGPLSAVAGSPIRTPGDRVTRIVRERFSAEVGLGVGGAFLLAGGAAAARLLAAWVTSGFVRVPSPVAGVLTAASVLLGVQLLFTSLFLAVLTDRTAG